MARKTVSIKRVDPWSVLKFGFLANIAWFIVLLLGSQVALFIIDQLELITTACNLAEDVGFQNCGLDRGRLFLQIVVLGLLAVVIQTGLFVFAALVFNLISDMTGGLRFETEEDGTPTRGTAGRGRNGSSGRKGGRDSQTDGGTKRSSSRSERVSQATGSGPRAATEDSPVASVDLTPAEKTTPAPRNSPTLAPRGETVQDLVEQVSRSHEDRIAKPVGAGEPARSRGSSREGSLFGPQRN